MGLFRRKREPFLTASPDAPVPGMSTASSVASVEVSPTGAPVDEGPGVVAEPFSLVVEDVFTITGRGTVVTGTVATGTVHRGDAVEIVRDGVPVMKATVSGVESFRKQVDVATAGANVGLLLKGVSRDQLVRDDLIRATS